MTIASGKNRIIKMIKRLLVLLVPIFFIVNPQWATAATEPDMIVHKSAIELETSAGWTGTSFQEVFKYDPVKEIHFVPSNRQDNTNTVSEIKSVLNGEIKTRLINVLYVSMNGEIWSAFLLTKEGRAFSLRKTGYDCFILSRGSEQGVFQLEKSNHRPFGFDKK